MTLTDEAAANLDIEACAREPIRIPGLIQPHGALLVLDPEDLAIRQASVNCGDLLGLFGTAGDMQALTDIPALSTDLPTELHDWKEKPDIPFLRRFDIGARGFQVTAHTTEQGLIAEFEDANGDLATLDDLHPILQRYLREMESHESIEGLSRAAAVMIREMTGFDRVLVYRFDEAWNGTVIAEENGGVLPSYLDLRFPASDIPAQARELYRLNRTRMIPDADYVPVPIAPEESPVDGKPLDLTYSVLRSVSPIHVEYMRNMGTLASMSISIVVDDALWGLVSCHHAQPKRVGAPLRVACETLIKIMSLQIGERQRGRRAMEKIRLQKVANGLLADLARKESIQDALSEAPDPWLALTNAHGAALVIGGSIDSAGKVPTTPQINAIVEWLRTKHDDEFFATDEFAEIWPPAAAFADVASGVIAVPISRLRADYLIWFRAQEIHTVKWGGDPRKPVRTGASEQLHPRQSFAMWKELVRHRALLWEPFEIDSAREFGSAIVDFVLRRAEERAALSDELESTNRELEAFSYSISHDLRAPFRQIAGFAELLKTHNALDATGQHYLNNICEAAMSAAQLVDGLLSFAHLGRTEIVKQPVDMNKLVAEIRCSFDIEDESEGTAGRRPAVEWVVRDLPPAWADPTVLRQVFQNLMSNALKFGAESVEPRIEIDGTVTEDAAVYTVRDNGAGFDMKYAHKLFGVFQRLHGVDEFEGTGIGLALAKRIVDRHGGVITAKGTVGEGALFTVSLPLKETDSE